MEEQTITITVEEYKSLRDICEEYQKLIGENNLSIQQLALLKTQYEELCEQYNKLVRYINGPEEDKQKVKRKIGF